MEDRKYIPLVSVDEIGKRKSREEAAIMDGLKKTANEARDAINAPANNRATKRRREAIARSYLKDLRKKRIALEKASK